MVRLTATEAARSFSDVLNRVAAGEEIEVLRSGAPVAIISAPRSRSVSADRFHDLIASAPRPDAEFATEVRTARESLEPVEDPWRS